jgi:anti-sigma factor RsiW
MGCLSENRLRKYLDNELQGRALRRAGNHLAACENCRERLEEMRSQEQIVNRALSWLDPQLLPKEVFDLSEAALRQRRAPAVRLFRASVPLPLPLLAGMVVLLLAMLGVVFLQQRAITRLSVKASAIPRPLEIMIGSDRSIQGLTLDLDMSGYTPALNPDIHIVKEKEI